VETALSRFKQCHPDFQGDVVLVGHSLGSVILFELLRHLGKMSLSFSPLAFFAIGSPIGIFLHCSEQSMPPPSYSLPGGTRFYNIFHPLDPVAYRVEPLFAAEYTGVPPEQVPVEGTYGGVKWNHWVKNMERWATGEQRKAQEKVKNTPLGLNAGNRVDWVLQDDLNALGEAGELLKAAPSHACYFPSADVAAFIQMQVELMGTDSMASEDALACVTTESQTVAAVQEATTLSMTSKMAGAALTAKLSSAMRSMSFTSQKDKSQGPKVPEGTPASQTPDLAAAQLGGVDPAMLDSALVSSGSPDKESVDAASSVPEAEVTAAPVESVTGTPEDSVTGGSVDVPGDAIVGAQSSNE